ncbi:MAG: hypothetical protein GQ557_01015 [Mycoplasmataceae bacterium]|nr:hypothetical protein [Mycoplasmataceae bacterium]
MERLNNSYFLNQVTSKIEQRNDENLEFRNKFNKFDFDNFNNVLRKILLNDEFKVVKKKQAIFNNILAAISFLGEGFIIAGNEHNLYFHEPKSQSFNNIYDNKDFFSDREKKWKSYILANEKDSDGIDIIKINNYFFFGLIKEKNNHISLSLNENDIKEFFIKYIESMFYWRNIAKNKINIDEHSNFIDLFFVILSITKMFGSFYYSNIKNAFLDIFELVYGEEITEEYIKNKKILQEGFSLIKINYDQYFRLTIKSKSEANFYKFWKTNEHGGNIDSYIKQINEEFNLDAKNISVEDMSNKNKRKYGLLFAQINISTKNLFTNVSKLNLWHPIETLDSKPKGKWVLNNEFCINDLLKKEFEDQLEKIRNINNSIRHNFLLGLDKKSKKSNFKDELQKIIGSFQDLYSLLEKTSIEDWFEIDVNKYNKYIFKGRNFSFNSQKELKNADYEIKVLIEHNEIIKLKKHHKDTVLAILKREILNYLNSVISNIKFNIGIQINKEKIESKNIMEYRENKTFKKRFLEKLDNLTEEYGSRENESINNNQLEMLTELKNTINSHIRENINFNETLRLIEHKGFEINKSQSKYSLRFQKYNDKKEYFKIKIIYFSNFLNFESELKDSLSSYFTQLKKEFNKKEFDRDKFINEIKKNYVKNNLNFSLIEEFFKNNIWSKFFFSFLRGKKNIDQFVIDLLKSAKKEQLYKREFLFLFLQDHQFESSRYNVLKSLKIFSIINLYLHKNKLLKQDKIIFKKIIGEDIFPLESYAKWNGEILIYKETTLKLKEKILVKYNSERFFVKNDKFKILEDFSYNVRSSKIGIDNFILDPEFIISKIYEINKLKHLNAEKEEEIKNISKYVNINDLRNEFNKLIETNNWKEYKVIEILKLFNIWLTKEKPTTKISLVLEINQKMIIKIKSFSLLKKYMASDEFKKYLETKDEITGKFKYENRFFFLEYKNDFILRRDLFFDKYIADDIDLNKIKEAGFYVEDIDEFEQIIFKIFRNELNKYKINEKI